MKEIRLYQLPKGTKVEVVPNEIWEFNGMDGAYGRWIKGKRTYIAVSGYAEVIKKGEIYITKN